MRYLVILFLIFYSNLALASLWGKEKADERCKYLMSKGVLSKADCEVILRDQKDIDSWLSEQKPVPDFGYWDSIDERCEGGIISRTSCEFAIRNGWNISDWITEEPGIDAMVAAFRKAVLEGDYYALGPHLRFPFHFGIYDNRSADKIISHTWVAHNTKEFVYYFKKLLAMDTSQALEKHARHPLFYWWIREHYIRCIGLHYNVIVSIKTVGGNQKESNHPNLVELWDNKHTKINHIYFFIFEESKRNTEYYNDYYRRRD